MKKLFASILVTLFVLGFVACKPNLPPEDLTNSDPLVYLPGSIRIMPPEVALDLFLYEPKFRWTYYGMASYHMALVDEKDFNEWRDKYEEVTPKFTDPPEMLLVTFVKHFDIPKEKFIEATENLRKLYEELEEDIYYEEWEIPNVEVIYTFDNDIINEYYRRE